MTPSTTNGETIMHTPSIILASRERKINQVMTQTGCTRDHAIAYLYAEEWFVPDAVMSYTIDQEIKSTKEQTA
jgi:hypothetical protein